MEAFVPPPQDAIGIDPSEVKAEPTSVFYYLTRNPESPTSFNRLMQGAIAALDSKFGSATRSIIIDAEGEPEKYAQADRIFGLGGTPAIVIYYQEIIFEEITPPMLVEGLTSRDLQSYGFLSIKKAHFRRRSEEFNRAMERFHVRISEAGPAGYNFNLNKNWRYENFFHS